MPLTVATAVLLLLQVPPVVASVSAVGVVIQNSALPVMVPAEGNGVTDTICVATAVPHAFDTV